jgi:uncharacterized protein YbaP (TraB family)
MTRLLSRFSVVALSVLLVSPAARATARGEKTFLWKVTSGRGEVYLLGSMHMAKKDLYPLPKEIEEAFARSKFLVIEADEEKVGQEKIQQMVMEKGMYPEGDTITKHLSKEAAKKLGEELGKSGASLEQVERFKPWLVGIMLSMQAMQKLGFEPDQGIDKHFIKEAKEKSREILEVESVEFQLNLLSSLTEEQGNKMLLQTLDEIETTGKQMDKIIAAWKKGDAEEINKLIVTEPAAKHPEWKELQAKLLDDRNVGMTAKVEEYLKKDGPYFVVVGAGHLVGEKGVIRLLEQKKYKVEQIERN